MEALGRMVDGPPVRVTWRDCLLDVVPDSRSNMGGRDHHGRGESGLGNELINNARGNEGKHSSPCSPYNAAGALQKEMGRPTGENLVPVQHRASGRNHTSIGW